MSPIDLSINHISERGRGPHQGVIVPALSDSLIKLQGGSVRESLHFEVWVEIGCGEINWVSWASSETHINFVPGGILVDIALSHYKKCKKESGIIILIKVH